MSQRLRNAARFGGLFAVALLSTGCMKVDLDVAISSDNEASGSATFAIDKQLLQLTGQTTEAFFREADFTAPTGAEDVSTKRYEDATFVGQTITFEGAPLSELNGSGGSNDLRIVRQGDEFHVSGVLDLTFPEQSGSGDPQVDAIAERAMQTADIRIRITFPGEVISSNGAVDGNSVTWRPKMGESTEIRAVASAEGSSSSPVMWIGLAMALLIVVAIVVAVARRSGRTGPVDAGPEAATPEGMWSSIEPPPANPSSLPRPPAPTGRTED